MIHACIICLTAVPGNLGFSVYNALAVLLTFVSVSSVG
jgi:hypothetical protein